jgi:hypothetical protein
MHVNAGPGGWHDWGTDWMWLPLCLQIKTTDKKKK